MSFSTVMGAANLDKECAILELYTILEAEERGRRGHIITSDFVGERRHHESHTKGTIVLKLHIKWALESTRWPHGQKIYILFALLNLIAKLVCIPSAFERHLPAGGPDGRRGGKRGREVQKERSNLESHLAGWEAQARGRICLVKPGQQRTLCAGE